MASCRLEKEVVSEEDEEGGKQKQRTKKFPKGNRRESWVMSVGTGERERRRRKKKE
jgi:hypothetical protein